MPRSPLSPLFMATSREAQGRRTSVSVRAPLGKAPKMRRLLTAAGGALLALAGQPAWASENGATVYLLGSGGPGAAVLPPLPGIYVDNTVYVYDGSTGARADFNLGGNLVANVDGLIVADFLTVLAVPSTNFLGGTLALGAAIPVGAPMVDASVC